MSLGYERRDQGSTQRNSRIFLKTIISYDYIYKFPNTKQTQKFRGAITNASCMHLQQSILQIQGCSCRLLAHPTTTINSPQAITIHFPLDAIHFRVHGGLATRLPQIEISYGGGEPILGREWIQRRLINFEGRPRKFAQNRELCTQDLIETPYTYKKTYHYKKENIYRYIIRLQSRGGENASLSVRHFQTTIKPPQGWMSYS